jgi:tRNA pseudouridine55 synthase
MPTDGVLVVDKPPALTSHDVVAVARRCLREPRIGHTGTLDPMATGVLALACGRATRLVRFLTASSKDYEAVVRFGVTTDTLDVTGTETSRTDRRPTVAQIELALERLRGEYAQIPPAFSAKKVRGERAYVAARERRPVALRPVPVRVTRAELTALTGDAGTFVISCSAGFYVRAFAGMLGELVETGACLAALRRTRSGEFSLADAVSMSDVEDAGPALASRVVPIARLLPGMPSVRVTGEGRGRVAHGQLLHETHLLAAPPVPAEPEEGLGPESDDCVRVTDEDGRLIAIASRQRDGLFHPAVVLL